MITTAVLTILLLATAPEERWITSSPTDSFVSKPATSGPPPRAWLLPIRETGPTVRSMLRSIAGRFARDTLGTSWPEWLAHSAHAGCEPYRAGSEVPPEEVFWVYTCAEPSEDGPIETECYLLDRDSIPTIERARWSAGRASGLRRSHADTLARYLATALHQELRLPHHDVLSRWLGPWMFVTELPTRFGTLRLFQGGADSDPEMRDSVILEHTSRRLDEALLAAEREGNPYDPSRGGADSVAAAHDRTEAAGAVVASSPSLARALRASPSRDSDLGAIVDAVVSARRAPPSPVADAILWGAHVWLAGLPPAPDTAAFGARNRAVAAIGGCYVRTPDDDECLEDSLAERLAARAGADGWTDRAFLEMTRRGWSTRCGLCGWDTPAGSDLFAPVIERGERFLRVHPRSPVAREVRWLVGEAHETAWSLSKAPQGDEYVDPARYLLDAPEQRARAVELYRSLLRDEPPGHRRTTTENRLRRLVLDVDTGYRPFWCVWD